MLSFEIVVYGDKTTIVDSLDNLHDATNKCLELHEELSVPVELHVYHIFNGEKKFLHDATPDFIKKIRRNI